MFSRCGFLSTAQVYHLKFLSGIIDEFLDLFLRHIVICHHYLHQHRKVGSCNQRNIFLLAVSQKLLVYASSHNICENENPVVFMLCEIFFKLFLHIVFRCHISINGCDLSHFSNDQLCCITNAGGHFSMCGDQNLFHLVFTPSVLFPFGYVPNLCAHTIASKLGYVNRLCT